MNGLPPEALEEVSQYFQALAEPTRTWRERFWRLLTAD